MRESTFVPKRKILFVICMLGLLIVASCNNNKQTNSNGEKLDTVWNEKVQDTFYGLKKLNAGKVTVLYADDIQAENKIDHKNAVVPVTSDVQANGNVLNVKMKANSFAVYRF